MHELLFAFNVINVTEWVRLLLLYAHLILCAFAIAIVLKTDVALLFNSISRTELETAARAISMVLVALWASGLAIIYLDTGFNFDVLATKSKLLFKLICVGVLTVNGLVLHHVSFPLLVREGAALNPLNTMLLVVTGGLSTSHWLLAAFVGLAKPLGRLPLDVLLSLYSLFLGAVLISSVLSLPLVNRMQLIKKQQPAF